MFDAWGPKDLKPESDWGFGEFEGIVVRSFPAVVGRWGWAKVPGFTLHHNIRYRTMLYYTILYCTVLS